MAKFESSLKGKVDVLLHNAISPDQIADKKLPKIQQPSKNTIIIHSFVVNLKKKQLSKSQKIEPREKVTKMKPKEQRFRRVFANPNSNYT